MKTIQNILMSLAGIAILASCTLNRLEEPEQQQKGSEKGQEVTFTAMAAQSGTGTRTVVYEDGPDIYWNPGDKIMVSYRDNNSEFVYNGEESVPLAEFQGWIGGFTGSIESQAGSTAFWAIYPFSQWKSTVFSEGSIAGYRAEIPTSQVATAGSFDPKALVTMACSDDLSLAFYNVCGGVKFSVTQAGIQQVEFSSNDGTPLAGTALLLMDDAGYPAVVGEVENASNSIVLTAPYGETFEVGQWYYLTCIPGELEQGFTMTFLSETKTGVLTRNDPVTVKRSVWGRLEDADADVIYKAEDNIIWNEIRYTTTDGSIISPGNSYMFTENYSDIVSNTYENGVGRIRFDSRVVRIPGYAFTHIDKLTSLVLPRTVKTLEDGAVFNCGELTEVVLPEGVESIGENAFAQNPKLEQVFVPSTVKSIGQRAFSYTPNLVSFGDKLTSEDGRCLIIDEALVAFAPSGVTSYTLPSGVTSISDYAFSYIEGLQSISIPEGVASIGRQAFTGTGLTSVTIPEGVFSISDEAFASCGYLATVSLPATLTDLGYAVFSGDNALERFEGQFASQDGRLLVQDGVIKGVAPAHLTELTIPGSISTIGRRALSGLSSLTKITLEDGVSAIEDEAFVGCSALEEIEIPASVTSFGAALFSGSDNLKKFSGPYASSDGRCLVVSQELVRVAPAGLTTYVIPDGITRIGDWAFERSNQLTSVTLKEGVEEIGNYAFAGCTALTGMTLPSTVTRIGAYAFASCSNLSTVALNEGLQEIADWAFMSCGLTELTTPSTLNSIGNYAFFVNTGLSSLSLNENLEQIGTNAFQFCTNLTELTIPSTVKRIGNSAFATCSALASLTLKEGLEVIEQNAFGNTALTEVILPSTLTSLAPAFGSYLLSSVTLKCSPSVYVYNSFPFSTYYTIQFYVPSEYLEGYLSTWPWSEYGSDRFHAIP